MEIAQVEMKNTQKHLLLTVCTGGSLFTKDRKASRPLPAADRALISWYLGLSVS